jgi:hypothetical protein
MRKIALLVMGLSIGYTAAIAQDTLIFEDFNDTIPIPNNFGNYPNAIVGDTMWTNWDEDALGDGSGANRPGEWFWTFPISDADSATYSSCFGSNSWTNDATTPVANWLISKSIQITDGASAVVSWMSAPRQTPYYNDGYVVLVSTGSNDLIEFTDTLFVASEYTSGPASGGGNYANYTFAPGGFVHGMDGTFIEFSNDGDNNPSDTTAEDSARYNGLLRTFTASLAAYDDMQIYIAWKHTSHDDNIIFLDNLLVTENTDPTFSIETLPEFAGQVYPNPATDYVNVKFDTEKYHNAQVQMVNSSGQVIYSSVLASQNNRIDLQNVAAGVYFVKIMADEGNMVKKVVVNK